MNKINFGLVLLGGIVAGVILNLGEMALNGKILATQMTDFFKRCGFPEPGTYFFIIGLGLGIEPGNVFAITVGWELVEYLLAAFAGAALYKEP